VYFSLEVLFPNIILTMFIGCFV